MNTNKNNIKFSVITVVNGMEIVFPHSHRINENRLIMGAQWTTAAYLLEVHSIGSMNQTVVTDNFVDWRMFKIACAFRFTITSLPELDYVADTRRLTSTCCLQNIVVLTLVVCRRHNSFTRRNRVWLLSWYSICVHKTLRIISFKKFRMYLSLSWG